MSFLSLDRFKYTPLKRPALDGGDSTEKLLDNPDQIQQAISRPTGLKAAIALTLWTLAAVIAGAWISRTWSYPKPSGIELKSLEFAPAAAFIEEDVQQFTGTAIFEEDGTAYREIMPGVTEFIGNGTEIDDNWHELIKDRYFVISEEEAKAAWPNDYQKYYHTAAGWYVGLDVFHTLHCVNRIRNALNRYRLGTSDSSNTFHTYHEDHCLDIVRQSIQCSADLTPIPNRRWKGSGFKSFIDSDQKHVCRNFESLRKFNALRAQREKEVIAKLEAETGREYVEEETAEGDWGFPERKGHEDDYRPDYLKSVG